MRMRAVFGVGAGLGTSLTTRVSGGPNAEMTMAFMDMLCAEFVFNISASLVCRVSRFAF